MKTRYLAILATLAFLGFSVPAAADKCPDPPRRPQALHSPWWWRWLDPSRRHDS